MSETSPIAEQANPETELARDRCSPEDLPHDALQTILRTEPMVQVENLSVGAGRTQVEEEEEEEEDVVNDSGRLVQPDAGGSSSGCLKRIPPSMTRGFPFPISSSKPVGQAFEANRNMIWSWLMDDEISTIGIYGMGGIGKTTLLQHIHDELLGRPDISHHVYWVTVPQDFSIYRLQNLIAKHLDLDLSSEYDILPRAAKLSEELTKKQEWILLLDDLWESFELSAVGIPIPLKGCKVIFTTRSNFVCQRMDSQVITEVRPLSEREALTLFMENLGHFIALSPELEDIAVDFARECAGLPLAIITLARTLRGVDDKHEWMDALCELKESKSGDKVVALQQCLLYCDLFPKGHEIEREELIGCLIHEGIIEKMGSREAAFHKGHAMLDTLENARLLQRIDGGRAVKMHDLVTNMANLTPKENPSVKIKDMAIRICKENPSVKEQRKGIEMASSNIERFWNHVEQTNDGILKCKFCGHLFAKGTSLSRIKWHLSGERGHGVRICGQVPKQVQEAAFLSMHGGNSTHKTMRRKRIEMAIAGIELPPDTPDDQDKLKKLKASKSRDMVDDFESGLTGAVSASSREQNNVDEAQQRETLLTGEFERANDLTGAGIELPPDTPDDQEPLFLALDSVHHVDRIVPPTIDEKYNRREATERLMQLGVGASSFGVYGNNDAISISQQEQNKEVDNNEVTNVISASAQQQNNEMMMAHQRGDLSLEDWMASITVEDEDLQVIGSFHERPSFNQADDPRGDPSQPPNDQLCSPSVNNDVIVNYAQQREPMFTGEYEWTNDFIGGGIEVGRCTPETIPITEHANPETDHCSPEELPHDEFQTLSRTEPVVQVLEQSKAERDNLSVDAGRTQVGFQGMEQGEEEGRVFSHFDMENTGEGSVQHVDRIVPPTIDEKYNRREATEILVQPAVCASAFVFYGDINAISTSQQEQNNEVDNVAGDEGTTPAAATRDHTPGRYFEEFSRWLMEDDEDEEPGEDAELLGPGIKRMAQLKSGWTLLMTSLIIEIASVVCDQLGYALVGICSLAGCYC